jgi:hypothetical protein
MKKLLLLYAVLSSLLLAAGCGVTYPKETLRESVIKVCKDEYKLDIDAGVFGNTLAIYLPIENLFDPTLNLSQHAQEKIQDTLLGASRVVS